MLLATGGEPKTLPNQPKDMANVTTYRTVEDFKKLDKIAKDGAHIAVVGGGFLGSELAVALAKRGMYRLKRVGRSFSNQDVEIYSREGESYCHSSVP